MPFRGVGFQTGPRSDGALQPMDVRDGPDPDPPDPHGPLGFRRPAFRRLAIVDRRCVSAARGDRHRPCGPVRKRVSPPATPASRAKSLKPACPLGTAPDRERGARRSVVEVSEQLIAGLKKKAVTLRKHILRMTHNAQGGHPGGSMSACDIVTALYFHILRVDPSNPTWPDRDRFVLSKGHACPVWYAALAEPGFFPLEELMPLRTLNSRLQAPPDPRTPPRAAHAAAAPRPPLSPPLPPP